MSINIPQYYKTYFEEQGKTILDVQRNLLDGKEVSQFKDNANAKNDSQKIAAINTQDLKLPETKPYLNIEQTQATSHEIMLLNKNLEPIDYYKFEDCVNNIKGLSKEQKSKLRNAIITSTESINNGGENSGLYGMRIQQTNLELKYISSRIVPKEYQDQFNTVVNNYIKGLSDNCINRYKKDAEYLINNKNENKTVQEDWRNRGMEMLDSIDNGTYLFQTSEKQYKKLYENVDVTNPQRINDQLNGVYSNILMNGTSYSGGQSKAAISNEVKYLAEKWNLVMQELGEQDNMKITTSVNYLV